MTEGSSPSVKHTKALHDQKQSPKAHGHISRATSKVCKGHFYKTFPRPNCHKLLEMNIFQRRSQEFEQNVLKKQRSLGKAK